MAGRWPSRTPAIGPAVRCLCTWARRTPGISTGSLSPTPWQKTSPDADLASLTDEAICVQQSYAAGIEGCWDDCWAQLTPWGFDVTRIAVPVLLLHGRRDEAVPFGHGQWLAARIPSVEARFYDNEGHGLSRQHIGEVHAWLTERP